MVVGIMACTTPAAIMADTTSVIVAGVILAITVITAAISDTIAVITAITGIIAAIITGIAVTIIIRTIAVSGTDAGMRTASLRAGDGRTTTMSSSGSAIERPLKTPRGSARNVPGLFCN
jgi:hypothetical protein